MKLVIDIPEEAYNLIDIANIGLYSTLIVAVKNGTPLPKGHGRLIDEESVSLSGIHFETVHDHAMMIGRLNSAQTIIEADR